MITIKNLSKSFGDFCVIDNLSLDVADASITSVLAPSGAGKTTLLRIVSGLEKPTSGSVIMDGNEITRPSSEIGFMFQENSAFPWLTVQENIEFGLSLKANRDKVRDHELAGQVADICAELRIERLLNLYPIQLSGGQKQRVVIARTLLLQPRVILCDEPFSSLDEITRAELRTLILSLHKHYSPTIMFITHNVEEAIFLGNPIVICSGPPLSRVEELCINFPVDRQPHFVDSDEFNRVKKSVKKSLERPLTTS